MAAEGVGGYQSTTISSLFSRRARIVDTSALLSNQTLTILQMSVHCGNTPFPHLPLEG